MKWFKFVIYLQLFFAAFSGLSTALVLATGYFYEQEMRGGADIVYATFPDLKTLDNVFCILFIVMAALCIFTRFRLSGYKRGAPTLYIILNVVSYAMQVAYLAFYTSILDSFLSSEYITNLYGMIGSLVVSGALSVILNWVYFNRRRHMFVK